MSNYCINCNTDINSNSNFKHDCNLNNALTNLEGSINTNINSFQSMKQTYYKNIDNIAKLRSDFQKHSSETFTMLEKIINKINSDPKLVENYIRSLSKKDNSDINDMNDINSLSYYNNIPQFTNNSTVYKHTKNHFLTVTSKEPISDIMISILINKLSLNSTLILGLTDLKSDLGSLLKTGDYGNISFAIGSDGSICEKKIWSKNPKMTFKQWDTVTLIRDKKQIQVLINGIPNAYNYNLDTDQNLYLSCTLYTIDDEIEILV